jgi:aminopeptidase N
MDKYLKAALSQAQAEKRFSAFAPSKDNITYNLFLKCAKGERFEGDVTINFDLQTVPEDLFLDFAGTNVNEVVINGTKVETSDNYESLRDRRFLKLPQANLKQGKNEVRIKYGSVYANDGLGMHSFVDTDGKQYIYSQCEAYAANKVLPCFDQPDLKASLTLSMAVPKDWVAVSNQPASEELRTKLNLNDLLSAEDQANYNVTCFTATPRLPTYLYAFIAGPYHEIKSQNNYKNITMSCYCRESLLKFLSEQAEEIFDITRETLRFYESYFGYPYPFEKYDSIFCPEYKFGAMENPGAVTFNDRLVWRETVTLDRNTWRADVITHEAAHMWFGDLVTMKWWNDLWLNESFADYISHFCLAKIQDKVTTTKFADPWLTFFNRKGWGYRADQQRTTHPIAGEVLNTDQAESIFDGITYSKGAATLKQLMRLIGEENFGKAMASYFKKFEWSNATLSDFIASLQEYYKPTFQGSPANLNDWKAEWLQTAGLNECLPIFNPADNSAEAKLVIKQSVALSGFPTLRHHKMRIAFFDENAKIYDAKDIMLNNVAETTITYDGSKQPKAVLLNYQDETFVKVLIDESSIAFLKEKIHLISDELTRAMIWRSLFDMVRDGKLSGAQFVEIAVKGVPNEPEDSTLNNILTFSAGSFEFSPKILNENVLRPKLFDVVVKTLLNTDPSHKNRVVLLREYVIIFASHGEKREVDNLARLLGWLNGTDAELKGQELDFQNQWSIVQKLHGYKKLTDDQKKELFDKVAALDNSDRMKLAEQRCGAMRADDAQRSTLYQSFLNPDTKLSVQMAEQAMTGYSLSNRSTDKDADVFFDNVLSIFQNRANEFAQAFYRAMFPHKENISNYLERVQALLEQAKGNDWLTKSLKDSVDDLERKRKGYICSGADVMREFFDISL